MNENYKYIKDFSLKKMLVVI